MPDSKGYDGAEEKKRREEEMKRKKSSGGKALPHSDKPKVVGPLRQGRPRTGPSVCLVLYSSGAWPYASWQSGGLDVSGPRLCAPEGEEQEGDTEVGDHC